MSADPFIPMPAVMMTDISLIISLARLGVEKQQTGEHRAKHFAFGREGPQVHDLIDIDRTELILTGDN